MRIIVGFSVPKNHKFPIFSWAIKWFYGTEYSHTYLRWHSRGASVDVCYEASGTSVNFRGDWFFKNRVSPIHEFETEIPIESYRKLLHFCMKNAARPYSKKQIVNIVTHRWFDRLFFKKDSGTLQVCSEVVGYVLRDVIGEEVLLDLDLAGPPEIFKIVSKSDKFKEVKK